jgi:FixJ family two-component response regulator
VKCCQRYGLDLAVLGDQGEPRVGDRVTGVGPRSLRQCLIGGIVQTEIERITTRMWVVANRRPDTPGSAPERNIVDGNARDFGCDLLLWIDDQIADTAPELRFLQREGFRIDVAVTGSAGLAMARTRQYGGILLDLNLPDIPGLAVLATMRAEGISTPVLVLTGFGDFESARVAGYFHASGFESKPLFAEDLLVAIRRRIQRLPDSTAGDDSSTDELRARFTSLAALLEQLQRASRHSVAPTDYFQEHTSRDVLLAILRAIANPALPMQVFLACAAALRNAAVVRPLGESAHRLPANTEALIVESLGKSKSVDPRVAVAIEMVRAAAGRQERIKINEVAETCRVDTKYLGRLIEEESGFNSPSGGPRSCSGQLCHHW